MVLGSVRGEPSWLHLAEDERIVWESRPHVVAMGRQLPIAAGLILFGLVLVVWNTTNGGSTLLNVFGFLLVAIGGVIALVKYVYWTNTRYVITSGELYKKHGVISRDVTQFRLDRVQNTSLEQSAVGRVFGYGELTIYTAGSGDPELTFERVPRPERAGRVLSGELVRDSSDPQTGRSTAEH